MKKLIIFIILIFCMSFVTAIPIVRLNETRISTEQYDYPIVRLRQNLTFATINMSEWWDGLDSPADITGSEFWVNQTDMVYNSEYWIDETGDSGSGLYTFDFPSSNISMDWFKGKFNWTTSDIFNSFDGSILDFNETALNESIDEKIKVTYYNATSIIVVEGTDNSNDINHLLAYDGITYNISESAGDPAMDVSINFTGVTDFNQLTIRMRTTSGGKHRYKIQIWKYTDGGWEDYTNFVEVDIFKVMDLGVYDATDHISGGLVQTRIYLEDSGIPTHEIFLDWVVLSEGPVTFSTNEIDPLSYHRDENIDAINSNLTIDYINFTGLIYGNGSQLTGVIGEVEDIWVNESGDTMTGNLNLTNQADIRINTTTGQEQGIYFTRENGTDRISILYDYGNDQIIFYNHILSKILFEVSKGGTGTVGIYEPLTIDEGFIVSTGFDATVLDNLRIGASTGETITMDGDDLFVLDDVEVGDYLYVGGNINVTGNINTTLGNISALHFIGDGSKLTGIVADTTWQTNFTAFNETNKTIFANISDFILLSHDNFADFVANEHIDWTSASANLLTSGSVKGGTVILSSGSRVNSADLGDANDNLVVNARGTGAIYLNNDDGGGGVRFLNGSAILYTHIQGDGGIFVYNIPSGTIDDNIGLDGNEIVLDSSARELKENIRDVDDTSCIFALSVKNFDSKVGSKSKDNIGLIADEVETVCPQFVNYKRTLIYEWVKDGEELIYEPVDYEINYSYAWSVDYKGIAVAGLNELQILKLENDLIKTELCKKDPTYKFCLGGAI